MDFCFATFAALFILFAAARGAPAGHSLQDACGDMRTSSLELNHMAKTASAKAQHRSPYVADFNTTLAWMEAEDMCDPESLQQNSATCIAKMLTVLKSYSSAVVTLSEFKGCSDLSSSVKPALAKLHTDMSRCVKSIVGSKHEEESHIGEEEETESPDYWEEALLCRYTMDRLFSFSILTARVFAVGDPSHHAAASAQKCS